MSVVLSIAIATAIGIPIALALDSTLRGLALPALGFLYGNGAIYFVMLAMATLGVRWSIARVTIALLVVAAGFSVRAVASRSAAPAPPRVPFSLAAAAIDLVTVYTLVTFAMYATTAPVWQWDFWMIWGVKGRVFLEAGTIDWHFLQSRWNDLSHPDYPLLVPLNYTWAGMIQGAWDDRWLGLFTVVFGVSTVLTVRRLAAQETSPVAASTVALATTAFALTAHVGMAEAPMIAYSSLGLLYLRRAVLFDERSSLGHAVVLLGLAANSKNEGIALVLCAAIALLMLRRPLLLRFSPVVALVAPWSVLRALHGLQTDVFRGEFAARIFERVRELPLIVLQLSRGLQDRALWTLILAGFLIAPLARVKRERLVLFVTGLQLILFVLVYLGTPADVRVHILTSWPRLPRQLAIPLLFIDLVMLATFAASRFVGREDPRTDGAPPL